MQPVWVFTESAMSEGCGKGRKGFLEVSRGRKKVRMRG